jgi:hypothetical protein
MPGSHGASGRDYPDQDFSLADRTSFAVMVRAGIERATERFR